MYTSDRNWSPLQRQAIASRGQNVVVSAGAGSGKTSVLVERVVLCVAGPDPVDINRLLIVTFTEAAAAEMRHRIRDRLHGLAVRATETGDAALAQRLTRQLSLLDQAQISTLHSFCMNIVRRNFLPLGLEPTFEILSEEDRLLIREEALRGLLEERLSDRAVGPETTRMLQRFGAHQPLAIAGLVYRLDEFSRSQPNPVAWLMEMADVFGRAAQQSFQELPWTPAFLAWVDRQLGDALTQLQEAATIAAQSEELAGYATHLTQSSDVLQSVLAVHTARTDLSALCAGLAAALEGRPRAKDHPDKQRVQALRKTAQDRIKRVLNVCGRGGAELQSDIARLAPDVAALAAFVRDFQARCAEAKQRRGGLDFNDLEHFALRALHDPTTGEAARLQEQFAEVFVDEYQDTSPIQDALIARVGRQEGNVFVVGDVKQSIYRFRMAEPQIFLDRYQAEQEFAGGRVIDLPDNYRSRPEVVDAVNYVFRQIFSQAFGGVTYDERAQMRAGAQYPLLELGGPTLAGPVELHLIERTDVDLTDEDATDAPSPALASEGEWTEADPLGAVDEADGAAPAPATGSDEPGSDDLTAIEKEAVAMATRIRELMGIAPGTTRVQVWDKDKSVYRPLAFRDIAVLMRSVRGRMNAVLEVFRNYQIPAYGQTSTGFYGSLEIKWLLAALAAIDNPRGDVDLAALLRSPLAGFQDSELALIRGRERGALFDSVRRAARRATGAHQMAWDGPAELAARAEQAFHKCAAFLRQFDGWRTLARRQSVETVLRDIMQETDFLFYVTGMVGGDVRRANVAALLDSARVFDRSSVEGVHGFVTYTRNTAALEFDAGEARTLGENEDVVRVTTIHQSKGLEYPVVFVADLGKQFYRGAEERALPLHRTLGFGPQMIDLETQRGWRTVPSIAIDEAERTEFLAEEARVLYVAMTRARERLLLVGSANELEELLGQVQARIEVGQTTLSTGILLAAKTFLDWLLPAILRSADASAPFTVTRWNVPGGRRLPAPAELVERADSDGPLRARPDGTVPVPTEPYTRAALKTTALRASGGVDSDRDVADLSARVHAALSWQNPNGELVGVPGKISATELRRLWVAKLGQPVAHRHRASATHLLDDPVFLSTETTLSARARGTAFHAVMQHLNLYIEASPTAVRDELQRIGAAGLLSAEHLDVVDVDKVSKFLASELAERLRRAKRVMREQPFFSRIDLTPETARRTGQIGWKRAEDGRRGLASAGDFSDNLASNPQFVVVQGVIDVLAEEEDGWLIVDYKTDRVDERGALQQAAEYTAQIAAYLGAVRALVGDRPVFAYTWFVESGTAVEMPMVDVSAVFRNEIEPVD